MAYGYIKKLSENVERTHVRYSNRYGLALAADLYTKKDIDKTKKHPALIVGAPYGGVKEQGPCVYADELAKRGFVVLTFDQVYMGESGGEPRNISDPSLFAESFSAAVDYLGVKVPFVDREKIGVIGICGSGGFALSAASVDTRIKAVATTSMYDISNGRGMMNLSKEDIYNMKKQLCEKDGKTLKMVTQSITRHFQKNLIKTKNHYHRQIKSQMNGIDFTPYQEDIIQTQKEDLQKPQCYLC